MIGKPKESESNYHKYFLLIWYFRLLDKKDFQILFKLPENI